MAKESVSSIHIEKLGHELEEIRVRALRNILSKLKHGFVDEKYLSSKKELITKLLNWFNYRNCPEKSTVLGLILRLFKAGNGYLVSQMDVPNVVSALSSIKCNVDSELVPLVEDIISEVNVKTSPRHRRSPKGTDLSVPHFIPESIRNINTEVECVRRGSETTPPSTDRSNSKNVDTEASTVEVHVIDEKVRDLQQPGFSKSDLPRSTRRHRHGYFEEDGGVTAQQLKQSFPYFFLPWQPLIATDRHVLTAVVDSLKDNALLRHTCSFITDVMLQDFPAEVFLQRPALVKVLFDLLVMSKDDSNKQVSAAVIKCLTKLTTSLRTRLNYYSDPCIANMKQIPCTSADSCISTPSCTSEQSAKVFSHTGEYLRNYASQGSSPDHNALKLQLNAPVDPDPEDPVLLQLQQLPLPQYCLEALCHIVPYVGPSPLSVRPGSFLLNEAVLLCNTLLGLLSTCVSQALWQYSNRAITEITDQLKQLLMCLGEKLDSCRTEAMTRVPYRLVYLQVLAVTRKLLVVMVPTDKADAVIPRKLRLILADSLLDVALLVVYPGLHEDIHKYVKELKGEFEVERMNWFNDSFSIFESMKAAARFMKSSNTPDGREILEVFEKSVPSLEYHRNLDVVRQFLEICVNKMHRWPPDDSARVLCRRLLLRLLAHQDVDVRCEMYTSCHRFVVAALGPHRTISASQLWCMFDADVLIEIVCHGISSKEQKIQHSAKEILVHLLKGRQMMSESIWRLLLEGLLLALPVLQCLASKASVLGRAVAIMLDPDVAPSMCLPSIELLRGNGRLLFSADPLVREEAASRIMWLLAKEPGSQNKLPHPDSLRKMALGPICLVQQPLDLTVPRSVPAFYQIGSLTQVVELLTSPGVEPTVRKSALTQVAVMLEDPGLHCAFVEQDGVQVVLKIFEKALDEKEFDNFPDSAVPIVCILKHLLYHSGTLRHELAQREVVLFCVIRALFTFANNEQLRHDASQVLCLLLFSDFVLAVSETDSTEGRIRFRLSLPEIVTKHMHLPFVCHIHWRSSQHTVYSSANSVKSNELCWTFLRLGWSMEWAGGPSELLAGKGQSLPTTQFSSDLVPAEGDLAILRASLLIPSCRQLLYDIQCSTTHQAVVTALNRLAGYLVLDSLLSRRDHQGSDALCQLPWEKTFDHFFTVTPSCQEDRNLLALVLCFLRMYLHQMKIKGYSAKSSAWIAAALQDEHLPLVGLLTVSDGPLLCELLALVRDCCSLHSHGWLATARAVVQVLRASHTQQYYDLAFLNWALTSLVPLTAVWPTEDPHLGHALACCLVELLSAFQAAASFMGLGVARGALLSLCHLHGAAPSAAWGELTWLPVLWLSRDVMVRAAALQLVAGICECQDSCSSLAKALEGAPRGLWGIALSFLLDHDEACLVREQGASVLASLGSNVDWSCKYLGQEHTTTPQDVLALFEECNFYGEVEVLVSRLAIGLTEPTESLSNTTLVELFHRELPSESSGSISAFDESSSSCTEQHVATTPSLVQAACWVLATLLSLDAQEVAGHMNARGLVAALTRCLGLARNQDTLALSAAVCVVLSHCCVSDEESREAVLHSRGSLHSLLGLLDTEDCLEDVWEGALGLLSALCSDESGRGAVVRALEHCGQSPLVKAVHVAAVDGSSPDLRHAALSSLSSLLTQSSSNMRSLLDEGRGGGRLCEALLRLYCGGHDRAAVSSALSGLLASSHDAVQLAFSHGLLDSSLRELRQLHVRLSLESASNLRKAADRRRLSPGLRRIGELLMLLTSFLSGDKEVREAAAAAGLPDVLHKLWVWCRAVPSLQTQALQTLCILTSECPTAAQSLLRTTTLPGVRAPRTPNSASLFHELMHLMAQQTEIYPRELEILRLGFRLLGNACQAAECRAIIAKGSLFQSLLNLHPSSARRQRHWDAVEGLWLDFLLIFTAHPEGQLGLAKVPDMLELLILLAGRPCKEASTGALSVLRNIAFHHLNRPRLLGSAQFVQLLNEKLITGSVSERAIAVSTVWALIANHQKAKLLMKLSGTDCKLQKALSQLELLKQDEDVVEVIKIIRYVLSIFGPEESKIRTRSKSRRR